jgi:hypothetical protein
MWENLIECETDLIRESFLNVVRVGKWWELMLSPPEVDVGGTAKNVARFEEELAPGFLRRIIGPQRVCKSLYKVKWEEGLIERSNS